MAVTDTCRDLGELVPYVRERVERWMMLCKEAGLDVRISETYRTSERQLYLYNKGASTVKTIGAHGFRVAVDFYFVEGGKTAYPPAKMRAAADIAKTFGFAWGGDWTSLIDMPHLEMLGGVSLAQYRLGKRPEWYHKPSTPAPEQEDEMVKRYNTLDEVQSGLGTWACPTIHKMIIKEYLKGDEAGNLDLTEDMIRVFVTLDRAGLYG